MHLPFSYSSKMPGQATRRRPDAPTYRCFLSDLTGFAGFRRAGPTRTRPVAYQIEMPLSSDEYRNSQYLEIGANQVLLMSGQ